jgi:Xaa-Pro aminopeptidase
LSVVFKKKNTLFFETISWAPIDIELINISLLDEQEIEWINNYHNKVYKKISPNLSIEEKNWLKSVVSPLIK